MSYWELRADPDGTDEAAEAKRVRRDAYLVPSPFGYVGQMRFGGGFKGSAQRLGE
jgi:hypothetical protein